MTSSEAVVSSVSSTVKPKAEGQTTVLCQTVQAWMDGPAGRELYVVFGWRQSKKLCAREAREDNGYSAE